MAKETHNYIVDVYWWFTCPPPEDYEGAFDVLPAAVVHNQPDDIVTTVTMSAKNAGEAAEFAKNVITKEKSSKLRFATKDSRRAP